MTVQFNCTLYAIYRILSHSFSYFLLFWKRICLFCIKEAKNKEINVRSVDNTENSSIL